MGRFQVLSAARRDPTASQGSANPESDNRTPDLHDHGRGLEDHGLDAVQTHGKGLEDHGQALKAHAYTTGKDILFKPDSAEDLAAHELSHVVQQRAGKR